VGLDRRPQTIHHNMPIDPKPYAIIDPKPYTIIDPKPYAIIDPKPYTIIDPKPYAIIDPKPYTMICQLARRRGGKPEGKESAE